MPADVGALHIDMCSRLPHAVYYVPGHQEGLDETSGSCSRVTSLYRREIDGQCRWAPVTQINPQVAATRGDSAVGATSLLSTMF